MNRKTGFLVLLFAGCSSGEFSAPTHAPATTKNTVNKTAGAEQMAKEERVVGREVIESGEANATPPMAPTNPPTSPTTAPPPTVSCDTPNNLSTATITVRIPKNDPTDGGLRCPFGTQDNNSASDENGGEYSARIERTFPITIPSNHVVCSMSAQSPDQTLTYDDHIFLMLNNYVLFATKGLPVNQFTLNSNGFYLYDWSKIRGKKISENQKCATGVNCQFPPSQQSGRFSFSLDADANRRLFSSLQNQNLSFKMVLTGDDNPPVDCRQSRDLDMSITYTYHSR